LKLKCDILLSNSAFKFTLDPEPQTPNPKPLKLKCDILLSTSAFKFVLRRYSVVVEGESGIGKSTLVKEVVKTVRRCRLTL
jgi:MoxR-like ATPase